MMQTLWSLFLSFCLIRIGAYGGGLVTVPLIQHELVETQQWLSQQEMSHIVAIAQMTPGPIAINAATFIGYRVAGIRAGVLSLLLFAVWSYGQGVISNIPELSIAIAAFLVLVIFERRIHPIAVIVGAGLTGLLIF